MFNNYFYANCYLITIIPLDYKPDLLIRKLEAGAENA